MYRPLVPITWDKEHTNDLLPSTEATEGGNVNTAQPSAEQVQKLRPWLDLSHHPTLTQVITLKRHLTQNLPMEIVDIVLSFADYWPYVFSTSSGPRTVKGKRPYTMPFRESIASAELRNGWSETTTGLTLAIFHDKTNLLVQSAPLGLSKGASQPWVSPPTQHPARMLIVEVTARRMIPAQQGFRRPNPSGLSHIWLDIGVVDGDSHPSRTLSVASSDIDRVGRKTLLDLSHREGINDFVLQKCVAAFHAWLEQRRSRMPGCLRVDLHVDGYLEGESKTIKSVYRFDDDEFGRFNPMNPKWCRILRTMDNVSEGARKDFYEYVKVLDDADRKDNAEFVRALRVGDEIGVWFRVEDSGCVTVIEGVRVTVFWEV